jgi:hypothetical protein
MIKINVNGKERTVRTTGIPDMNNPLTAKLLETMCKAGDKVKTVQALNGFKN